MNINDLVEARESIQYDLMKILDGLDGEILGNVCQVICDRFQILINKNKTKE
jgi:hypothetical protein